MSMNFNVYINDIDDSKIEPWIKELNKLGMKCEIHPDFSFKSHSGFLPFKINISENSHDLLLNKDYLTGFEYFIDDFNLDDHTNYKKQTFIQKVFGRPKQKLFLHSKEIDEKLMNKKFNITFNFGVSDTFELRIAYLASACLSKITNGLCCDQNNNIWYENHNVIEKALVEI